MKIEITLDGEVPSKKNSRIVNRHTGRNYPSKRFQKWHDKAICDVFRSARPSLRLTQCKSVNMVFYHADKRRRDTNNQAASVFDLLVDCGILADDNWTVTGLETAHGELTSDGAARCEITIEV